MLKKLLFSLIIVSFTAYPTVPLLAQANSSPNGNGGLNQNQNQEIILQSPQSNGDFLNSENNETAPNPAGTIPVEKKEGTIIENPAGTAPSDTSEETPEEPPATDDDPPVTPHQYSDGVNGTVEKSKFNKANGEMQVDSFSGAVTYNYTLDLPPGRSGLQPSLRLSYNSQLKNFSNQVGVGWELPLIDIHRDYKKGNTLNPENGNHNYLVFNFYGSNQPIFPKTLVDDYHGEYTTNNSDYSKIEYKSEDDSWEVIDKNGTKYILGTTAAFRLQAPGTTVDPRYINKWLIKEIRDTNNNFINFEYFKDSNQIYPKIITYTGNGTTNGPLQIRFQPFADQTPADRTDVNTSYEYRIDDVILTKYLINRIDILVNSELKKKYQLSYSAGDNGYTSLLTSIQEIGVDNGQELTRPATTFEYTLKDKSANSFINNENWKAPNFVAMSPSGSGSVDFNALLVDLNGDGLIDIDKGGGDTSVFFGENGGTYINNGVNGWYESTQPCSLPTGGAGTRAIDINGDGLTDLVKSWRGINQQIDKRTYLNMGNCTYQQINDYILPIYLYDYENNGDQQVQFADINNDNFIDIVDNGNYINNGQNGWVKTDAIINPQQLDNSDSGVRFADVNGDGFIDELRNDETYLNDGSGELVYQNTKWVTPVDFVEYVGGQQPYNRDLGTRLADVNGDGLVDIINGTIYLNDGVDGFNATTWSSPVPFNSGDADNGARLVDFNGDNLVDIVIARYKSSYYGQIADPEEIKESWINQPAVPNLLKNINNGYGKTDEFSYKTSANFLNADKAPNQNPSIINSAYIDSLDPTNHQSGTLKAGYENLIERWITYAHPDLSQVPEGNNIISFRLVLNLNANFVNNNLPIYKVDSSWNASNITWETKPTLGGVLCNKSSIGTGIESDQWTFYCHGPLDENGIALKFDTPNPNAPNPHTDIIDIDIYDIAYQTAEPYNPNPNLNSTIEVVDEIQSNDGINLEDSVNNYEYSNGAKATSTSKQIMPVQITTNVNFSAATGQLLRAKMGQTFIVNVTDDYNLAKVWIARNNNSTANEVKFFIATVGFQGGTWYPLTTLTEVTVSASQLAYAGSSSNTVEYTINFPTPAHLNANYGTTANIYWLGIEGIPNDGEFNIKAEDSNQYDCNVYSPYDGCIFYYWDGDEQWWNYYGDMWFSIGKQGYTTTRQNYELSGFGKVETTDQDVYKNITYFHQGGGLDGSEIGEYQDSFAKRGRAFRTENYNNNGDLLLQTVNKWGAYDTFATSTFAATSTFVFLEQSTNSLFNGSGSHKDTAKVYTYDFNNGNLLAEEAKGEVTANIQTGEFTDITGDEKLTTYEYATSPEALHILGAPMNKVISDPNLSSQIHQDYYYDNLPLGQVEHLNVTKEDLPAQTIDYEYTYNDYGLVTQKKDPYENTTTIAYDANYMYPATTTNPLNQVIQTTYDLFTGELLESIDPNGLVTQNTYDALGRLVLVKTSDPVNPTQLVNREAYEYHDFDFPWWIKKSVYLDTTSTVDTFTYYDGFGRVIQEKKQAEAGNFTTVDYWYDERGNMERQTLPYFTQTSIFTTRNENQPNNFYTYDALDRVLTVTNSLGTTSNSYDLWQTTITDANGKTKNIYHNAHDKLSQVDEILNSQTYSTAYDYNYLDLITNITDSQGNTRDFVYDDLGRLTSQQEMHKATSTTFGTWSYEYDLNSNLTQKVDPKNQVIAYIYDDLNRILTEDSDTTVGTTDVSYVYDQGTNAIGRLTSVTRNTNPTVSTSYAYDILGRVSTETKNIKDRIFNTSYAYDLLNNPLTINYPENFQARYVYNNVGQTNEVYYTAPSQAEQQIVSSVSYSPLAQISQINYTNGTETNNTYDPSQLYRLSLKQTTKATTTLQNISYTYDPVGNITQITDTSPNQLAKTADYVYDDLYRLTTATITTSTVTNLLFSYDPIGNITNKSDLGDYTYASINPYQANQINGINQTYDDNGNLTSDTVRTLTYDYQDRLTSSTINNRTTSYYYDHGKTRVTKYNAQTGAFTQYPNKYFEKSNDKQDWYIFLGNQRLGVFEATSTSALFLNFTDHLNSSSVTTDSQGNITNLNDYLPYGSDRVNVKLGSFNPSYKFTDQESDSESGLYYYGARYYNQGIGRFIQVDPVSLALSNSEQLKQLTGIDQEELLKDPQALNNYSYSRNNPVILKDKDGNFWQIFGAGVGAVAGLAWSVPNIIQEAKYIYHGNWSAAANQSNIMMSKIGYGTVAGFSIGLGVGMIKDATSLMRASSPTFQINNTARTISVSSGSNIRFTQSTFKTNFSSEPDVPKFFQNRSIDAVANDIKINNSLANQVRVGYIERDGYRLIDNTRSAVTLQKAGIDPSKWNWYKITDPNRINELNDRLNNNNLSINGTTLINY